jgi:hypothetical protein
MPALKHFRLDGLIEGRPEKVGALDSEYIADARSHDGVLNDEMTEIALNIIEASLRGSAPAIRRQIQRARKLGEKLLAEARESDEEVLAAARKEYLGD